MKKFDEKLVSWFRYLFWADICYKRVGKIFDEYENIEKIETSIFIAFVSQWYGSLYVVIEGWKELKLEDKFINKLLNEHQDLIEILRRYRNCVYHFQPELLDKRIIDFVKTEKNISLWLNLIHNQFIRYFSYQLTKLPGNKRQKSGIKIALKQLIGWIPENTYPENIFELNSQLEKVDVLLKEGTLSSRTAKELRLAFEQAKILIKGTEENYYPDLEKRSKSIITS